MTYAFSTNIEGPYIIPNPDVDRLNMVQKADSYRAQEHDWYLFHQMENSADTYSLFLEVAALNSFFISIKVVKYVGLVGHPRVKVFTETLRVGLERNAKFTLIILLLLTGFALFFMIIFGPAVETFSRLDLAAFT